MSLSKLSRPAIALVAVSTPKSSNSASPVISVPAQRLRALIAAAHKSRPLEVFIDLREEMIIVALFVRTLCRQPDEFDSDTRLRIVLWFNYAVHACLIRTGSKRVHQHFDEWALNQCLAVKNVVENHMEADRDKLPSSCHRWLNANYNIKTPLEDFLDIDKAPHIRFETIAGCDATIETELFLDYPGFALPEFPDPCEPFLIVDSEHHEAHDENDMDPGQEPDPLSPTTATHNPTTPPSTAAKRKRKAVSVPANLQGRGQHRYKAKTQASGTIAKQREPRERRDAVEEAGGDGPLVCKLECESLPTDTEDGDAESPPSKRRRVARRVISDTEEEEEPSPQFKTVDLLLPPEHAYDAMDIPKACNFDPDSFITPVQRSEEPHHNAAEYIHPSSLPAPALYQIDKWFYTKSHTDLSNARLAAMYQSLKEHVMMRSHLQTTLLLNERSVSQAAVELATTFLYLIVVDGESAIGISIRDASELESMKEFIEIVLGDGELGDVFHILTSKDRHTARVEQINALQRKLARLAEHSNCNGQFLDLVRKTNDVLGTFPCVDRPDPAIVGLSTVAGPSGIRHTSEAGFDIQPRRPTPLFLQSSSDRDPSVEEVPAPVSSKPKARRHAGTTKQTSSPNQARFLTKACGSSPELFSSSAEEV